MDLIVSCGVLVFRREPRLEFLLMEHADRWDLPKGHVDPGETETEAALRELVEETGIKSRDIELDARFRYEQEYPVKQKRYGPEPRQKRLVIFLGWLQKDCKIRPTEHIGHKWFRWNPPHQIQQRTIDPVLAKVASCWNDH